MSTITIIEGNSNDKDNTRLYMVKGEAGATISTITKTGTTGLVDTYTITLDDGRTQTFTVTNGKSISSITKTDTTGLVDTYTITFNDNTTETFTVTNGYSPTANVTKSNGVATITITDENGTTTANVNDGTTYEVPANGVIGWDSSNTIPAGYEEIDNPNNYLTTETVVGTWLGKPLYRKVVNTGALPNATTKEVAHNISNLKNVVRIYGYAYLSSSNITYTLPHVAEGLITTQVSVTILGNNIRIGTGIDRSGFEESYITLEYTKTTD